MFKADALNPQIFGFGHKLSLYLNALYHFAFRINSKKSKPKKVTALVRTLAEMTEMRKFRNEVSSQVPPTSEIVKLAAMIAAGKLINQETALAFANQAIELWEKSEEARNKKIDLLAMYARAKAKDDAIPKPKSYPVN